MNTKNLPQLLFLTVLIGGCASTPAPNAALESARTIVRATEADPNVAKYAALDLEAARKELQAAEAASLRHDEAGIAQPAYLAAQTARLAQYKSAAKADDARVADGQAQRDSIRLAARTREVDTARLKTNEANLKTDEANRQAESAKLARDQAADKAASLQAEVDALKAKPTDRGLVLTLGDVLFESGKAELSSGAARNLDRLVQFLTEHPERRVQIDGYTDSIGADSYNQDLSQRRADAVRSALLSRGIAPTRIASQGYGKEYAVASNSESSGRQLNRRVEVVIGDDSGAAVAARR